MRVLIPNCKILSCWDLGKTFGLPLFLLPLFGQVAANPMSRRCWGLKVVQPSDWSTSWGIRSMQLWKRIMHMHCRCIMSIYDIIIHYMTIKYYKCDMLLPMLPRPDSKVWDGFFLLRCKSHCKWNCIAEFAGVDCKLALATARAGHAWNTSLHYRFGSKNGFKHWSTHP